MAEAHKWEFKARFRRHAFAICVRTERDPKLRKELESAPKAHAELRRYREAGASAVALYRFAEPSMDAFFTTAFMQDYSEAVFIEGDCPIDYVDRSVFVAPVPSKGHSLLRRVVRAPQQPKRSDRSDYCSDDLARALRGPATPSWLCPSRSDPAATGRCLGGAAAALAAAGWAATPARLAAHRASPLTCYTAP